MRLLTRSLFAFAELKGKPSKGVGQYLKGKKIQTATTIIENDPEELNQSHRLLYLPFFPATIMALPILYFLGDPTNPLFNSSLNFLQYYLSGIICFNSFFSPTLPYATIKSRSLIMIVAAANCLTEPYSMITALILGGLNFYAPFTDEKAHKFQSEAQETRVKAYMKVQGLVYFLAAVLLTLRFHVYQQNKQMQIKLAKFQSENKEYFKQSLNSIT